MVAVQLLYDCAAPGDADDVGGAERQRVDQRREAIGVVRQAEVRRHIRGAARPRLVPGDDAELVGQGSELRPPHPAVIAGAVHEQQRRSLTDALIGDLKPVRLEDLHRRQVTRIIYRTVERAEQLTRSARIVPSSPQSRERRDRSPGSFGSVMAPTGFELVLPA